MRNLITAFASALPAEGIPTEIVYLPEGEHRITPFVDGKAKAITLKVPAVRRAYPAARFVRVRDVGMPRTRHLEHEGEVRLKTDYDWWAGYQNDPLIGGFGVPWEPYGFHSGMGQEDVSREEAERLGLKFDAGREVEKKAPGLNEGLSASVRGMDPEVKRKLIEELRGGPKPRTPEEAAREAARRVRERALARAGMPSPEIGARVVEDGGRVRLG